MEFERVLELLKEKVEERNANTGNLPKVREARFCTVILELYSGDDVRYGARTPSPLAASKATELAER
jgi:hypothetical protein